MESLWRHLLAMRDMCTPHVIAALSGHNSRIPSILEQIKKRHEDEPDEESFAIRDVDSALWTQIDDRFPDKLNFKLQYLAAKKMIFITYPTDIHESLSMAPVKSFHRIVEQGSDSDCTFLCHYNSSIDFTHNNQDKGSSRIPDFAFARQKTGRDKEYLVILGFAVSQSSESLKETIRMWINRPDVTLVLGVDLKSAPYHSPLSTPEEMGLTTVQRLSREDLDGELDLSRPIIMHGLTFASPVTGIEMTVECKDGGERFDITPPDSARKETEDDLEAVQSWVDDLVASTLRVVMGDGKFDACFPSEEPFTLHWKDFHKRLCQAKRNEAYARYKSWWPEPAVHESPPAQEPVKLFHEVVASLERRLDPQAAEKQQRLISKRRLA
ncbi:hypothetical protein DFH06DRAFT_1319250 [Mycena polygramma]|nr:hypothetical protein DFH06DRAFT_1319250 [Mycena polygramma]